jgi:hypothetical protein
VRPIISLLFFLLLVIGLEAQPLKLRIEPVSFPFFTGVQSYSYAFHDNYLVLIGGRLDGLHKRRPFESFLANGNNSTLYIHDVESGESYTYPVSVLAYPLNDQLQSTNMEFYQDGDRLILIGGYGYSTEQDKHTTYPYLLAIDLPCLVEQVKNDESPEDCFTIIEDERMAVTGGQLSKLDDGRYYLVGGQFFDGLYNPMGPTHGPGFTQEYTDEIRRFRLKDLGNGIEITDYQAWHDELNLHRRDYNMSRVLLEDGKLGLVAFSGVFQRMVDLPFLNAVLIDTTGYEVKNDFAQYYCQYHSAKTVVYDDNRKENHVIFLGGISQFYNDAAGNRVEDQDVPFVKTISGVTVRENGELLEWVMQDTLPGYLGASAEFIPNQELVNERDMIAMHEWEPDREYLMGYLVGGIQAELPNSFFLDGEYSEASNAVLAVYGTYSTSGNTNYKISENPVDFEVFPNPAREYIDVSIDVPGPGTVYFYLQDTQGSIIYDWESPAPAAGKYKTRLILDEDIPVGTYILGMSFGYYMRFKKLSLYR